MNADFDYLEINRKSWNNRVDVHLKSDFYDVKSFTKRWLKYGQNFIENQQQETIMIYRYTEHV